MSKAASTPKFNKRYLAFISLAVIIAAILAGYFYYKYEERLIVNNQRQNLEAIAVLKIEQINKWMEEKIQNADNVSKNPYSLIEVEDLLSGKGAPNLKEIIVNRLKYRLKSFNYENIYLTTPEGKVVLSADPNDNELDTAFLKDIKLAGEKRVTMFSDFRYSAFHKQVHLLVISPNINKENKLLGFLVFAIDPSDYLFPLLQKWPTESETAETTFYEKDGTDILIINELRHQPNTALKLRIPLANTELPAVKAINGERGLVDGIDYRGRKVLAYVTQFKGTNWYINAKIDKDEIFVELKYRAYFISIIVILMVLFTSTLAAFLYNSKQRFILQSLVLKDEEIFKNRELLDVMGNVAKIGGWEFDVDTRKGSWTKEVARIHDLEPDDETDADTGISFYVNESKQKIINAINDAVEKGIPYDLELEIVTLKGSHKWVRTIGEPIKKNGKVVKLQGSFQDITDKKKIANTQEFLIECGSQGENFFESLAVFISEILNMGYVCIDKLETDGLLATTVAVYNEGRLEPNVTYALKDTPCGDVVDKSICVFPNGVAGLFPNDKVLADMHAESYIGTTLVNSKGKPIGLIAVIDMKPLSNPHLAEEILKIIAIRAAGELERNQAEEALRLSEERYKTFINSTKDIIFIKDDNFRYVVSNEANNQFLKKEESEILGKTDFDLMPESIARRCNEGDKQAIEKGNFIVKVEIIDDKYYEATKFPVQLANGKIGVGGYIRDITTRRNAEEALKSSEEKYRILFESNNDGISIFYPNPDGTVSNFVDVNDAAAKMLGYTKDEYKQLSVMDLGEDVSADILFERQKALMANKVINTETRIKHKNGQWVDVEITITTIIYNNRIAIMNIVRDISERKRSEAALKESEEKLRLAMLATKQGWFELNIPTGEILVSDSYLEIIGYEPGEFDSTLNDWLTSLHPDDVDIMKLKVRECIESGDSRSMEYRRKTKAGEWKWLRSVGKVVEWDSNGRPLKMSGTHMDISDRKLAEEELRVSEENFRNLVESMPEGYYRSVPEGKFLYVNPAFAKMLGYDSKEDLMSIDIPEVLYFKKEDRGVLSPQREEFNSVSELYRLKRKDGSEIWIEDFCRYIKDEKGNTIMHEGVCRDITTRKRAEEELIKAKDRAEELSKIKSNFLANMSHELRTPMVGILGFSEVLKSSLEDEEFRHYAEVIHKGGTRLMETLNLILNISAIESDNIKVINEDLDLISEVKEVIEVFEKTAIKKNIKLSYLSDFESKPIHSDRKLLHQVLSNLINNSVKYTEEGSILVKIEEVIKNEIPYASIKVIDTGIGIPVDKHEIIWEEFRQVSEGLSRGFEGTGLGLSITKKFVNKLGGEIFLEASQPGKGSTFTILLPLGEKNKDFASLDVISEKVITPDNSLPLALYVDDDSMSVDLVKVLLKSICKLDSASSGLEAVEKAKARKYNVILMDINLGKDIDGLVTTGLIRAIKGYEKTPVVAVTALAMKHDREKFLSEGCTEYISKPFLKEEFVSLISKVLYENKQRK